MSLDALLQAARADVEGALDRWLPPAAREPRRLHEAMRYAVFAGGKRLRPAIASAACCAVGGTAALAMPAACALEMLHTYSLIHDDLPALDDDDLRRGRPTVHKNFDEATAILAGDALQTHAFEFLVVHVADPLRAVALVRELAVAAGTQGMVGGEMADLEAEGEQPDRASVEWIHERKTAALFSASAAMGGISGGADEAQLTALRQYGVALGLAFQVVDDILDETSDSATLGKSAGKDRAAHKMTYPAAVGLDASRQRATHFAQQAQHALDAWPDRDSVASLVALAEFTVTRIS